MAVEDVHFFVDNAPPAEVVHILRVLSADTALSKAELKEMLSVLYGFTMQKKDTHSPRRLDDLKLTVTLRSGGAPKRQLTPLGHKLQVLIATDENLSGDLLHYLHYTNYRGLPEDRKLFWSYRRCCEYAWASGSIANNKKIASDVQSDIDSEETFKHLRHLKMEREGMRFDARGVNEVFRWVRTLEPSALDENETVKPRTVSNFHLPVLALDDFYRHEGLAYGSAIVLTDEVLDKVARVFFLDATCCRDLLKMATYFTSALTLADTLVGMSVTLNRPYTLDDL
jgi:hypothetical protein